MDNQPPATSTSLALSSSAFSDNQPIPVQYTCKGENVNPPLAISDVPAEAKALALIVHDPDAVSGDFVHWLMWDIPLATTSINANTVPVGAVQGQNDGGQSQYMGPCPPASTGTHRYMFKLYALDTILNLPAGSERPVLEQAMQGHVLAKTTLTGLFASQ
ncbi:hypothetical protein A3F65_00345 [Candidatus Saccharibacteria bacterium RIFCSPHIGHO2_12_FULL_47_16b]|nr:MAG: hypothetical protein A3F65_00345 [Candidatus Saccharibacteria bacterium RIFCSPHIGHO2_12_FULL_47_16b]